MKRIFINAALSLSLMSLMTLPAIAAPAYRVISRDRAVQNAVEVQVGPGRATAVNFSQSHERITYVLLAAPSAIRQGYTPATDPIVARVQQMLSLVRGDHLSIAQAANSTQVPINVLKALERLGTPSNGSPEPDVVIRPLLPAR